MPGISWYLATSCDPMTISAILSWPLIHSNALSQRLIPGLLLCMFLTETQAAAISHYLQQNNYPVVVLSPRKYMSKTMIIGYWLLNCPKLSFSTKQKRWGCVFYTKSEKCWCCLLCFSYRTIRPDSIVRSIYKATGCSDNPNHHVIYLEHVVVRITITHPRRGDLAIYLTSPSGTRSQLLANRYSMTTQFHSTVSM